MVDILNTKILQSDNTDQHGDNNRITSLHPLKFSEFFAVITIKNIPKKLA